VLNGNATHKTGNRNPASHNFQKQACPLCPNVPIYSRTPSTHRPNRETGFGFESGVCDGGGGDGQIRLGSQAVRHTVLPAAGIAALPCASYVYFPRRWLLLLPRRHQRLSPGLHRPTHVQRIRHLHLQPKSHLDPSRHRDLARHLGLEVRLDFHHRMVG